MKFDRMVDKLLASKNQKEYQRNYEPVVKAYGTYKTFSDLINRIKALPKNNETPSSNGEVRGQDHGRKRRDLGRRQTMKFRKQQKKERSASFAAANFKRSLKIKSAGNVNFRGT